MDIHRQVILIYEIYSEICSFDSDCEKTTWKTTGLTEQVEKKSIHTLNPT